MSLLPNIQKWESRPVTTMLTNIMELSKKMLIIDLCNCACGDDDDDGDDDCDTVHDHYDSEEHCVEAEEL